MRDVIVECNACGTLYSTWRSSCPQCSGTGTKDNARAKDPLEGVAGWLFLFCFGLLVVGPLFTLYSVTVSWAAARPLFNQIARLRELMIGDSVLTIVVTLVGMYAGLNLVARKPNAVRFAKTFLLLMLIGSAISAAAVFLVDWPSDVRSAVKEQAWMQFARGLLYFAVWYAYLEKSKRVKATFRAKQAITQPV